MARSPILATVLLSGCVGTVNVEKAADITCWYDGRVIFSGEVELKGTGLEGFERRLFGAYHLCGSIKPVRCWFDLGL